YDGTNARVYVNGVLLATQGNPSFVPNADSPFSIGARSDNGFPWQGAADEVAYYGTVLSPAQVLANYNAGIAGNPSAYATQILGFSPLGSWRLDDANEPVAVNLGSLGSAGNGKYFFNALPGQTGPQPPTYAGLEGGNTGCGFN